MYSRVVLTLAVALTLSACVSTTPSEPQPPALTLDARGLQPTASPLRVDFGRAQDGVIDTVSRLLDDRPETVATNAACGAGPVTSASWDGGLTLNFQNGQFVGWTNADPDLAVAGGFRSGQSRLQMPQVSFQITSLGTEFARNDVFGLLTEDDAAIRLLWAGTTCFFR